MPFWGWAVLLLALVVVTLIAMNAVMSRSVMGRHEGDAESAIADEDEPLPSAHVITDDDTALGDTQEAHEEVNPHDLPIDHPARREAESEVEDETQTTRGTEDLTEAPPRRAERLGDG